MLRISINQFINPVSLEKDLKTQNEIALYNEFF